MPIPALFRPPVPAQLDAGDGKPEPVPAEPAAGGESRRSDALLPLVRACLRERTLFGPADDAKAETPGAD